MLLERLRLPVMARALALAIGIALCGATGCQAEECRGHSQRNGGEGGGAALDPAGDEDDDGWSNGEERANHTDPLDADDHPYIGGWDIGACRWDLEGEGTEVGQVIPDFELVDQHGELVRIHDFCHKALLIEIVHPGCGPCQVYPLTLNRYYEEYRDRGFLVVSILAEDVNSETVTIDDLIAWMGEHDYLALADPAKQVMWDYMHGGYPSFTLVAPGGVVTSFGCPLSADIEGVLP